MDAGARLYAKFLNGEEAALAALLQIYREPLVLFVNGIVNNIFDAEDIAQEVFVTLFVKRPAYKAEAGFKTWLYAVAKNKAVDFLRKKKRETAYTAEETLAEEALVEDAFFQADRRRELMRFMADLNPAYREVLFLTYFEGLSNKQTARVMKKSVHAVETLNSRARAALRRRLEQEDYTDENL